MCLTVGGEEEGRSGIGVIHGGIPHGGVCPPSGGIPGPKVGEECWNSSLDARLEAVVASDEDITPLDTNNNPPLNVQGPITRARAR
jgi:hypothetical protein